MRQRNLFNFLQNAGAIIVSAIVSMLVMIFIIWSVMEITGVNASIDKAHAWVVEQFERPDIDMLRIANDNLIKENKELRKELLQAEVLANHYRDRLLVLEDY